jgi:hypothetical protein
MEHPEWAEVLVRGHRCLDDLSAHEAQMFEAWILREIFHMQNVMQLSSTLPHLAPPTRAPPKALPLFAESESTNTTLNQQGRY